MMWLFGKNTKPQSVMEYCAGRIVDVCELGPIQVQVAIDCRGAVCPRPQLLTMKALDHMPDGDVVELLVDNPSSVEAIPAMALTLGSSHLITVKEEDYWSIYVRKGIEDTGD